MFGAVRFFLLVMLELRKQGSHNLAKAHIKGINHRFHGIMCFAFSSNLSMTLSTSVQEFDVLLVGALADPASAGLYYMAKRMAKAAQQLGGQVQAVLYPDVTRLWAAQAWKSFRRAIFQAQFVLALFGVCALAAVVLSGRWLIRVGPGDAFMAVWPLLIIQIIAVTLTLHGAPSRPALLAMGRQHPVFRLVFFAVG